MLASFFHATILSHDSLQQALAFHLAEQLGNAVVSALVIHQVLSDAFTMSPEIIDQVRLDLNAYYDRDPACDHYSMPLLYFKGFQAIQLHRVSHWLWQQNRKPLALYLQNLVSERFSVDIHPGAKLGAGIMLDHATGLVIGETATVGDDVSILHSVTLGGSGCGSGVRHPQVQNGVLIAAGAKILGNVTIGECAKIGAGSLVLYDVAAHTTVAGVPARQVGKSATSQPALLMDQRF